MSFFQALFDPSMPFLRYALLAGLFSSVSFGIMGTYVVVRRISYMAGGISHAALAGIGAALFMRENLGWSWAEPLAGAVLAALLAGVLIARAGLSGSQREDTVIGAIWATGMAIGLLFISKTRGYTDPMSYLFGNILLISRGDLWMILALDALILFLAVLFYPSFLSISFDEEFARSRGLPTGRLFLLLVLLVALTVVLMVSTVGIVMVIALLTLPAAGASLWTHKLSSMMILAAGLCAFYNTAGLVFSFILDWPTGATTIALAGGGYFLMVLMKRINMHKK